MRSRTYYAIAAILLVVLAASAVLVTAQESSPPYDYWTSQSGAVGPKSIQEWRQQSSGLEQKIAALSTTASASVSIPILFGVGVKDLVPNFGDSRLIGRTHEGEDILAATGTPVVSPTTAVVIQAAVAPREGNYVVTANPGGETFVYMHLDSIGAGITSGRVLSRGSLVGYVGSTGNAAGGLPMLHFEIRNTSGVPTDPFPRLTSEFSPQEKMRYLNNFLAQISGNSGSFFSRTLCEGVAGGDVRMLQKILNWGGHTVAATGPGSPGNETARFGMATQAAVIGFQMARGIVPATGCVGPATRAALARSIF